MYKPLPEIFRKSGMDYQLLHRTERTALYLQTQEGRFSSYEVHRVQRHNGRSIAGQPIEPAEFLASDEQFGQMAWTLKTLPAAMNKFSEQEARPATEKEAA